MASSFLSSSVDCTLMLRTRSSASFVFLHIAAAQIIKPHVENVNVSSVVEDAGLLAQYRACLRATGNSMYVALSSSQCLSSSSKAPQ